MRRHGLLNGAGLAMRVFNVAEKRRLFAWQFLHKPALSCTDSSAPIGKLMALR